MERGEPAEQFFIPPVDKFAVLGFGEDVVGGGIYDDGLEWSLGKWNADNNLSW